MLHGGLHAGTVIEFAGKLALFIVNDITENIIMIDNVIHKDIMILINTIVIIMIVTEHE